MKNLMTITGAPATKKMVVNELAKHLGRTVVYSVALHILIDWGVKAYLKRNDPRYYTPTGR